jgi:alcohol dehydrogenase class IV
MRVNAESAGERFRKIALAMGAVGIDAMSIDAARVEAVRLVYSLAEGLRVPTSLRAIGASKEDIPALVASTSTRAGRAAGAEGPDHPNEPNSRGSRYADESRTTSSGWNRTCW